MSCSRCRYPNPIPDTCKSCGAEKPQTTLTEAEMEDLRGMMEMLAVHLEVAEGLERQRDGNQRLRALSVMHGFDDRQDRMQSVLNKVRRD